jgi:mono/diheme cytochrome c family protein
MKRFALTMSLLLLPMAVLSGCDWMPGRPIRADIPPQPQDVHDFDTLWTTYCSGCHGADGRFGPARPMNDPLYLALADDAYLTRVTTNGVSGTLMPPMAKTQGGAMTTEQVQDIVKGMRTNWGANLTTQGAPSLAAADKGSDGKGSEGKGSEAKGKLAFSTWCGACHGDDGRGTDRAGSVVDSSFLSLMSDQGLRSAIVCGRLDLGMPNWQGRVGTRMSDARSALQPLTATQVGDIVAWLVSHRVEYPGSPYPDTIDVGGAP